VCGLLDHRETLIEAPNRLLLWFVQKICHWKLSLELFYIFADNVQEITKIMI